MSVDAQQAAGTAGGSETQKPDAAMAPRVCPYLGRRLHPEEFYAYATSHNVCHARPQRDGRSYSHVRRHIQARCCLESVGGWVTCRLFLRGQAAGVPSPRPAPSAGGETGSVRVRRRRKRRSRHWRPAIRQAVGVLAVLAAAALLGLLLAGRLF